MKIAAFFIQVCMAWIVSNQQKLDELLDLQDFIHNLTDTSYENTQQLYLVSSIFILKHSDMFLVGRCHGPNWTQNEKTGNSFNK